MNNADRARARPTPQPVTSRQLMKHSAVVSQNMNDSWVLLRTPLIGSELFNECVMHAPLVSQYETINARQID